MGSSPGSGPSILFINRVYPPAPGATGQLLADVAEGLAREGSRVTVVTSGAGASLARSETINGVRVERVRGLAFTRNSHLKRALGYLALYPALGWRAARLARPDVLVTMTDPPLQLALGPALKLFKRCRVVHWAQDIYPELAEELGVIGRGGAFAGLLRWISTVSLRGANAVVAVGRCMKSRLIARGLDPDAIHVIPNWGHAAPREAASGTPDRFRQARGLEGRLVVMYAGNLGLAHPFESILGAAADLQHSLPQARFVFVGDGPRRRWVESETRARQLDNVSFLPPQPRERLPDVLAAADVHLACMEEPLVGLVVPSKVSGVLAAGRPCFFLGPARSEAARWIVEIGCGEVLSPNDAVGLANALKRWLCDGERLERAGTRAREAAGRYGLEWSLKVFGKVLFPDGQLSTLAPVKAPRD